MVSTVVGDVPRSQQPPNNERITAKRGVADRSRAGGEAQRGARELNEPERRAGAAQVRGF